VQMGEGASAAAAARLPDGTPAVSTR